MNRLYKLLLICIVVLLSCILVSCNDETQNNSTTNQDQPSQISIFFYKDAFSSPYEYKTTSSILDNPTLPIVNPGYTIKGFQDENNILYYDYSTITDGLKLFIIWEPIDYTIVLHFNGANSNYLDFEYSLSVGSVMPDLPMDLKLQGYIFNGWYKSFDEATKKGSGTLYADQDGILNQYALFNLDKFEINTNNEVHLYAGFSEIRYTILFIYNNSAYQNEELSIRANEDVRSILTERLIDTGDKQIVYWSLLPNGEPFINSSLGSDIALYAIWKKYCHVNVELNGGELDDFIVLDDEIVQIPTPKKIGYDFDGWFTNNTFSSDPVLSIT